MREHGILLLLPRWRSSQEEKESSHTESRFCLAASEQADELCVCARALTSQARENLLELTDTAEEEEGMKKNRVDVLS